MTKMIAKTNGQFGLLNTDLVFLEPEKPTLTCKSTLLIERAAEGTVTILAQNIPMHADGAVFAEFLADAKDTELAIASFLSTLEGDADTAPPVVLTDEEKQAAEKAEADRIQKEKDDQAEADRLAKEEADKKKKDDEAAAAAADKSDKKK